MRTILIAAALATALTATATAQDTKTMTPPGTTSSPMATPSTPTAAAAGLVLTEQEGKDWIDKPIYSSDGVKLGEVVVFQRDPGNRVLGMHADIGGFLGYLQTRVSLLPAQFKLQGDRVVLGMTAEQAKSLPKVQI
jgi:hypothetical protein